MACVFGYGLCLHPANPRWGAWCVFGCGLRLNPANPGRDLWRVFGTGFASTPPLPAGDCGMCVCVRVFTLTPPILAGARVGCVARRCAQEPPSSSALFACLPKPHHLVWLKSVLGPITTCLHPIWWLIFSFVRNSPFSRIFYTPPPCCRKGGSSTLSAPFPHPLCALFAPPFWR